MRKSKKKIKRRILVITGLLLAALFVIVGVKIFRRLLNEPSGIEINKSRYPITGIDISLHTGKINFTKIREQKIDFVYIKSSEGFTYKDKNFETNYVNARNNNIPVGVYHYFRFTNDGRAQAANFLRAIKGKEIDLPLALDVEEWGQFRRVKREVVINEIRSFLEEMERNTSRRIIFYSNENCYRKYIEGVFDDHPIWICSFNDPPEIEAKWTFWQHSHIGELEGAQGKVDINTFNGSREDWERYLGK
jgi:lysozyme